MLIAVRGLRAQGESQKIFKRSRLFTNVPEIKEAYLNGKHSIVDNLPHPDMCVTESDGNHAIASIRNIIATRTTLGK